MMANELTCQQLVELVTDYFEEALPAETRQQFEAHLARCAPCRVYVAQMRVTIELTGQLREEDLAPETKERLLDLFRRWQAS
jgi:anti-sigma factor RsiW